MTFTYAIAMALVFVVCMVDAVVYLYAKPIFSVSNFLFSPVVNSYKLLVCLAGISNSGFFLMFVTLFESRICKLEVVFLYSTLSSTMSHKSLSN